MRQVHATWVKPYGICRPGPGRTTCLPHRPRPRPAGRAPPTRRPSNEKKALEEPAPARARLRGAAQNRTELRKLGYSEMKFAVGGELGLGLKSATSVGQSGVKLMQKYLWRSLMPTRGMGVSEGEFVLQSEKRGRSADKS